MEPDLSAKSVQVIGRYALYDAIAAGGMATVHYGRLLGPVGFSRTVAIKRLHTQYARDPEFVSMFLDEARLAARIRHPNVVPTLDVVATGGELFLVMEYVAGESLARLVRTAAGLGTLIPPRIVAAIMCGVLRGLHAAHEATNERGEPLGIVHRDVSPQNVLVGIDGQSRVLDFGVAKAAGRLQTTRDGKLKGKLAYMSPEQLRGKTVDRRTDVFAASTVLWEALTGRRLFRGDNEGAIVTRILDGVVEAPSSIISVDEADETTRAFLRILDPIVLKGLATHVDERYDSARTMAVALERAVPPAGVSEVSEWVEHFAKDVLVTRAQQVADIESSSAVGPAQLAALRDAHDSTGPDVSPARPSQPRISSVGDADNGESRSIPVDLSSISVASQASRPSSSNARKRMVWMVASVVGLFGAICVFFVLRFLPARDGAATSATSPSAETASTTPSSTASTRAVPPSTATSVAATDSPPAADPAATATTQAPAVTPKPAVAAGAPRPPTHAGPRTPAAPAAPPHAASNCNPPFTYDGEGLKHFKPECM